MCCAHAPLCVCLSHFVFVYVSVCVFVRLYACTLVRWRCFRNRSTHARSSEKPKQERSSITQALRRSLKCNEASRRTSVSWMLAISSRASSIRAWTHLDVGIEHSRWLRKRGAHRRKRPHASGCRTPHRRKLQRSSGRTAAMRSTQLPLGNRRRVS